jgi:polyhydroxyalkanoate synthesis regulator phasin
MNIQSAQQRPFVSSNPSASSSRAASTPPLERRVSTVDSSGAEAESSAAARGRLMSVGESIQDRVDELLSSGTLTREEAAAVTEASEQFDALLERLNGALESGGVQQDGKLARAFHHALDSLRGDVREALAGDAAQTDSAPQDLAGRSSEASQAPDSADLAARLAAAFDRIDDRLSNVAQQRGREGGAEIRGLQGRFGQVFDRLESAVAGGMNPDALGDLFERMLSGLRDGLGGGTEAPMIYDSRSAISPLGGLSQGGLDAIA